MKILRAAKFFKFEFDAHNIDLTIFATEIREKAMHQINPINQRRDEIAEVAKLIDSKHYFEDSNLNSIEK